MLDDFQDCIDVLFGKIEDASMIMSISDRIARNMAVHRNLDLFRDLGENKIEEKKKRIRENINTILNEKDHYKGIYLYLITTYFNLI